MRGADNLHVPIVMESGSLNLLEPTGPVQACTWIALPLPLPIPIQRDSKRWTQFRKSIFQN